MFLNLQRKKGNKNKLVILLAMVITMHTVQAANITNFVRPVFYYVNHEQELIKIHNILDSFQRISLIPHRFPFA